MQKNILNYLKTDKKQIVYDNFLKIISITYLLLFCTIKLCTLTKVLENMNINTIMFILGWIILLLILVKKRFKIHYPKILAIFISSVIINFLFNFDIETLKTNLFELFYIFTIYNIAKEYFKQKDYINLIKITILLTFFMVFIFYIQYIILLIKCGISTKSTITYIVFSNINGGALLAIINIIMVIYLYKINKTKLSTSILLCIYYTVFVIISQARTALFALIILALYFCCTYFINNKYIKLKKILSKIIIIFLIIITIIFSVCVLKKDYNYANKVDNFIYKFEQKIAKITTLRYWLWKYSVKELIKVNPIFGLKENFGEDSFKGIEDEELLNNLSDSQKEILNRNDLHNGYIQILVRNGLFGFTIYIIFLIIFILNIFKINNTNEYYKYIKYLYLFYICINFFENNMILSNSFFVLLLWINIGMDSNILEKEKNKQEKEVEDK